MNPNSASPHTRTYSRPLRRQLLLPGDLKAHALAEPLGHAQQRHLRRQHMWRRPHRRRLARHREVAPDVPRGGPDLLLSRPFGTIEAPFVRFFDVFSRIFEDFRWFSMVSSYLSIVFAPFAWLLERFAPVPSPPWPRRWSPGPADCPPRPRRTQKNTFGHGKPGENQAKPFKNA